MSNPSFPELLKIGCTGKDPELRKAELHGTGVPTPFHIEYLAWTKDFDVLEKKVHKRLRSYRELKNREFFRVPITIAVQVIRELGNGSVVHEEFGAGSEEKINKPFIHEVFHNNGQLKKTTSYSEGMKQGQCKEFFEDGTMKSRTNYVNNIENGMRKHFNQEGNLIKIGPMVNGSLHGYWRLYDKKSGSLTEEGVYFHNNKVGKWKVYCSSSVQPKWVNHGGKDTALTFVKLTKEKCQEIDRERELAGRSPLFAGANE